jgi:hypothetical protein
MSSINNVGSYYYSPYPTNYQSGQDAATVNNTSPATKQPDTSTNGTSPANSTDSQPPAGNLSNLSFMDSLYGNPELLNYLTGYNLLQDSNLLPTGLTSFLPSNNSNTTNNSYSLPNNLYALGNYLDMLNQGLSINNFDQFMFNNLLTPNPSSNVMNYSYNPLSGITVNPYSSTQSTGFNSTV